MLQIHMDLNPYAHQHWKNFHASLLMFMVNNNFRKLLPLINTSLWKCFFFYKLLPSYIYIWHVFKLFIVHKDGISHLENISRIILLSHLFVFFKFHLVWCSMLPLVLDLSNITNKVTRSLVESFKLDIYLIKILTYLL